MWRKMISMGFKWLFLCCVGIFLSCGTWKKKKVPDTLVQIEVYESFPHCGGAAPEPGDSYPNVVVYDACTLVVCEVGKDGKRGETKATIITDENGSVRLSLAPGKYELWHPTKLLPFDEFLKAEKTLSGSYFTYENEACFRSWYEKPDFEFEVGEASFFKFVYYNRCFTRHHPCLIYTGPFPP